MRSLMILVPILALSGCMLEDAFYYDDPGPCYEPALIATTPVATGAPSAIVPTAAPQTREPPR